MYSTVVSSLKFRFDLEGFTGRVPSGYTSASQKKYLKEAGHYLKLEDDKLDSALTHPPWVFYTVLYP